ncbi:ABC transporter permease [Candidatus Sumerlaeota bacterium]|nr:ABC transporter permease [Candidatus Sumerlaeota bacterium]
MGIVRKIVHLFHSFFLESGAMVCLLGRTLLDLPAALRGMPRTLSCMMQFGFYTLPLAAFIGLFIGMVTSLQTGLELKELGLVEQVGSIVGLSVVQEMGPVITAFIICGRVGAAMTAELGTMAVTEEIDVLRSLGISPVRFLVVPRFVAAVAMVPILTVYSIVIGVWGGALVATSVLGVAPDVYYKRMFDSLELYHVAIGMSKTFVFGAIIAIVCCHTGLRATNGVEGVGKATMRAVVVSLTAVLISDFYLISYLSDFWKSLLG